MQKNKKKKEKEMITKVTNSSFISEIVEQKVMVEVLDVSMKTGAVYRFYDVPKDVCKKFRAAKSKGKFFTQNIKDNYMWEEL